jgi:hypothetical protein
VRQVKRPPQKLTRVLQLLHTVCDSGTSIKLSKQASMQQAGRQGIHCVTGSHCYAMQSSTADGCFAPDCRATLLNHQQCGRCMLQHKRTAISEHHPDISSVGGQHAAQTVCFKCAPALILSTCMLLPVSAESATALRRIWPPPSSWEPAHTMAQP